MNYLLSSIMYLFSFFDYTINSIQFSAVCWFKMRKTKPFQMTIENEISGWWQTPSKICSHAWKERICSHVSIVLNLLDISKFNIHLTRWIESRLPVPMKSMLRILKRYSTSYSSPHLPIGWPWYERDFAPGCEKSLQQTNSTHFSLHKQIISL